MDKITNLKKEDKPGHYLVWRFEYDGIKTEVVEAEWDDEQYSQAVDIIMQTPNGRYFQKVFVSAELFTSKENEMLNIAAEMCLKAYEKRDKSK